MSKPTILVVEDEQIVAFDVQMSLNRLGYCVPAVAASAEQAIETAERLLPDLVLMDIHLSGEMDGIQAGREIRERFDIPVVFVTAMADASTLSRISAVGAYGHVGKPFRMADLRSTIDGALERHRARRATTACGSPADHPVICAGVASPRVASHYLFGNGHSIISPQQQSTG